MKKVVQLELLYQTMIYSISSFMVKMSKNSSKFLKINTGFEKYLHLDPKRIRTQKDLESRIKIRINIPKDLASYIQKEKNSARSATLFSILSSIFLYFFNENLNIF